jgi:hypothetical protein
MLGRHPITDGLCGAALGLVIASLDKKRSSFGSHAAVGSALGVAVGALVRRSQGARALSSHYVGASSMLVGWSPPPHPIDFVASFDPRASKRDQARAVLNSYLYDNDTRDWADDGTVKSAFGSTKKPIQKKEDYDPAMLIAAYENPQSPVWRVHGGRNSWNELDKAVQKAIAKRTKLGPLPKSNYESDPVVIYYYDNDRMKKITYPRMSIPVALNPQNLQWWRWGMGPQDDASKKKGIDDIHTFETQDPKSIAAERAQPGFFGGSDHPNAAGTGGHWHDEGFDAGKDLPGNMGVISSTMMQVIGTVLEVIPGVGTAIGSTLIMAAPYVQQIANMVDVTVAGGDNAAALAGISKMLVAAASAGLKYGAGVNVPPMAVQALGVTIDQVSQSVDAAQKQKLDFASMWTKVAKKAASFGKLDDTAAHVIATVLGEDVAGKVFLAGHQAGKLADLPTVAAIAKIVQPMGAFTDPKITNLFLLGAGIGHISQVQEQQGVGRAMPTVHGASPAHAHRTHTGFFYDPLLARFGNAMSPFVSEEVLPYDKAVQAMHLRPEDRYGSRLNHPNWVDWSRWW